MTKTVSSRIENRIHNDLIERCNKLGCNINEFVSESVKLMLYNESDFEFEPEIQEEKKKPIVRIIDEPKPEIKNVRIKL